MDKRVWLSRRALRLHAVVLVVVPSFMALCVWQIHRALGGNELSWAYVFEWPLFACYAVYMWWRLVHEARDVPAPDRPAVPAESRPSEEFPVGLTDLSVAPAERTAGDNAPRRDARSREQDDELAAYNEYLAQLAERDRAAGR